MLGIKYLRMLNELSLQKVADKIGVSKQTASKWENGKVIPSKRLQQLSELFDIQKEYLQKELNEIDKVEIQKIKVRNDVKNRKERFKKYAESVNSKSDLKIVSLDEMVDMLNEVATSEQGSITVESKGIIDFGMISYSKNRGNEWRANVNSETIDKKLDERFIIVDYEMQQDSFSFDSLEIIGDIIWDESTNEFKISLGLDLEIVIRVYDYKFKVNEVDDNKD